MSRRSVVLAFLLLLASTSPAWPQDHARSADAPAPAPGVLLEPGDTIALVGGGLAERMQHHGWFETQLQARRPDLGLTLRNLGFSADELTVLQRTSGFGSPDEHLTRVGADVVLGFWGFNESFAGTTGLDGFRADLRAYVDHTLAQRYSGASPARLILVSPLAFEETNDPLLPRAKPENARLRPYVEAMREVAAEKDVPFIDLFDAITRWRARSTPGAALRLTLDGMQLTERGDEVVGALLADALLGGDVSAPLDDATLAPIRRLVLEKNRLWFNRYRATDGYNVYGGRSGLTYDGVTNFEVLQHELVVIDALAANVDREIHAAARGEPAPEPLPVPALMKVETNRPGPNPDGTYTFRSAEEAIDAMTPAPGMRVELFADESRFPLLRNPVQMSWDTRGRLWVAVWPTYPHWTPGEPMDDALLIFEDLDGDGRADTCTPFADDLHNPTGFEFWNGGVFVANPPDILFLKDTDGDDRADSRERVVSGLSSGDTHHSANSFVLGPDGALYFQEGIFHQSQVETVYGPVRNHDGCVWRYEPRTARVQRYAAYGFLNPHGHVFDAWGQDFVTDGTGNVNYYALPFSGFVEPGRKHGGYFPFFEQRSRPAAATEILSSAHFPQANQGNFLIANVIGFQGIFQYALRADGSGFGADEVDPLLHSSDPQFRPVDMEVGPDGALYFVDWQNPLIGHMQHHLRDPNRDHGHGRIYRVRMDDRELLVPEPIAGCPLDELFALLHSPDDRVRYRARIELSGRDSREVVAAARRWVEQLALQDVDPERPQLEALWVQQQHGVLDEALLARVLRSHDPRARAAAVRVLRWMHRDLTGGPDAALDLLAAAVIDENPQVRLEAVVALSEFESARAAELALKTLDLPSDRFLDYALTETLATLAPSWRAALFAEESFAPDDPQAQAYVLTQLGHDELLGVRPTTAPVLRELMRRHETPSATLDSASSTLGAKTGRGQARELLDAIDTADASTDGHADHLLVNLFTVLAGLPRAELDGHAADLATLVRDGRRAATRRLATAASMRASGSSEPTWSDAARSLDDLAILLDAAPMVRDETVARELFPKVAAVLSTPTAELARATASNPDLGDPSRTTSGATGAGVVGRRVRIELPGEARTLTLAEVEVFAGEENVAPRGTASQSTTNWGGVADHAIDGNTSGSYGDGGQTHTIEDLPDPWWQLELPASEAIDRIVVWNRTESAGQFLTRLDGFVVRVLDDAGRSVWESGPQPAPERRASLELLPPALRARRAAAVCLAELGVDAAEAVRLLLAVFDEPDVEDAVIAGLSAIPLESWPGTEVERAARGLLARFADRDAAAFMASSGRRALHLADLLAPRLAQGADASARALHDELVRRRRALGPQIVVLHPVRDSLTYDLSAFTVQAGRPVELLFDNTDIMPHNVLVATPGSLATIGEAAEAMASLPDAWERAFVPELPEVLWASGLLQPGESETLRFDAPAVAGDHPYLCTFPGHWIRMNGVMHVVDALPEGELVVRRDVMSQGNVARGTAAGHDHAGHPANEGELPARRFVRNWTVAELLGDLAQVDDADPALGREILETASCLRCHREDSDGQGARTGPAFSEVVGELDRAALLRAVLAPSDTIRAGFESEVFFLEDGGVLSGRVLAETEDGVSVLADPYSAQPQLVPKASIHSRRPATLSVMPEGLLTVFTRDEILALLAYLESLDD